MYDALAKKIPDKIRSERLMVKADPIENAARMTEHMELLFAIYTQFVFPAKAEEEDITCWKCCMRIINCFQEMKPHLVKLEKQYKLLNAL